ncbi:ARM REPEAT PROTEIN INTERACTING WITH ABF2-like [Gastrolobium bilobum]|uniref:ARM REPEAT PROTEIN INTERACTING WITH ABF2-like n=1 Tax=Gastrolobium bilobum TaxID=150636 RepID=UPI002AAFEFE2|nr:ARM REPEAT PROTEIN INTERACTING WITH ABF2-like [Gastrolobium bilobum]
MDRHHRSTARQSLKRKREQNLNEDHGDRKVLVVPDSQKPYQDFSDEIFKQVELLNVSFSPSHSDLTMAKTALNALSELAKNEDLVDTIVDCGAVPVLVTHLQVLKSVRRDTDATKPYRFCVERGCTFVLTLLAVQPEHQKLIVDAGALPYLIDLLRSHETNNFSQAFADLLWRVADTITNLAHENDSIKTLVRTEGGIPPLVELLEYNDTTVQRAAAGALRTLAFKNVDNKNQIIECDALPTLVLMLQSEDPTIHHEAVGVIGNLVHSSPNLKKDVLQAGALQPVISLLSSSCSESQREAALLLGQFASTDSDCKVHIAQRGAIQPLVNMLKSPDKQLREMSAFALGRLAQDSHNQAGIAHSGGLEPLLNLLGSTNVHLQHNAAFALYGLADNEDNVTYIIKAGGLQKLQDGFFRTQPTKECVAKILKRLGEKMQGRVLKHLLHLMHFAEKDVQRRIALSLAHLCFPDDRKTIFVDNNGLELLLDLLESTNLKQKGDGSVALHKLATRGTSVSLDDAATPTPTRQVHLDEQYVNNPDLSDVTFLVEGKRFYAHRVCLLAYDIFRAMLDGGYREREAKEIEIPNIKWDVFELMMRFIYAGTVDVNLDTAQDLLRAADQYLLDDLKRLCEHAISQDITVKNVSLMYDISEAFNATSLKHACVLFVLAHFDELSTKPWYCLLLRCIVPSMRKFFTTLLTKPYPADS